MNSRKPVAMAIVLCAILAISIYSLAVAEDEDDIIFIDNFEAPEPQSLLNDTGIDWWADGDEHFLDDPPPDYPGQDADFGRDALAREGELDKVGGGAAGFDFTKLDADGNDLPASASEWSCVRDNHTGLIWEVKVNDGFHLQHKGHTYTWYNPDDDSNGGQPGEQDEDAWSGGDCTGSFCDTHAYVMAVNNSELCGASDWRMPSREELRSIIHYGRMDSPAIDEDYFPHTEPSFYWSATTQASSTGYARMFSFESGDDYSALKSYDGSRVRLLRVDQ